MTQEQIYRGLLVQVREFLDDYRLVFHGATGDEDRFSLELSAALAGPIHQPQYDPDHPLVHCPDCDEEYTACDLGNHYCPTCGESSESATEVACPGCPCLVSGGSPCCFCGVSIDDHEDQRTP